MMPISAKTLFFFQKSRLFHALISIPAIGTSVALNGLSVEHMQLGRLHDLDPSGQTDVTLAEPEGPKAVRREPLGEDAS